MNVNTGQYVDLHEIVDLAKAEDFKPEEWVEVIGTPQQIARLSTHVRLGAGERANRKARRKAQRSARRRNR